ncbi:MAG: hypothetical protein KJ579_03330 [Verrucomicrobia bacterium]|nr:hypothetical protein [Verrucomicrobiota bacterium]
MNRIWTTAFGIAAAVWGLAIAGCEDTGSGATDGSVLVTRDVLADGTVRTVYERTVNDGTNVVVQTIGVTQPVGGPPTTNITATGGIPVDGGTNGTPIGLTSRVPVLPAGAPPLPSAA